MTQKLEEEARDKKELTVDDDAATTEMKIGEFSTFKMCHTFIKPLPPSPEMGINGCSFILGLNCDGKVVSYYFQQSDK